MIHFSQANIDDLPFIIDVYNSTIASHIVTADTNQISITDRINWFHEHDGNRSPIWLIFENEIPCGWISLSSYSERIGYNKTREISLYLKQEFRGKNIGQQAIKNIEQHAKRNGVTCIISRVFKLNEMSLKLFRKQGYSEWGLLPKIAKVGNVEHDLIILGKHLL